MKSAITLVTCCLVFLFTSGNFHGAQAQALPVAFPDQAATFESTAVVVDLLANDSAPDGDPLRLVDITMPSNGTVADNGDGTVSYAPIAGFYGTDAFQYEVSDGQGGTAAALVTITVKNSRPVASIVQEPVHGRLYTLTVTAGMQALTSVRIDWRDRTPQHRFSGLLPAGESYVVRHEFPRYLRNYQVKIEAQDAAGAVHSLRVWTPGFQLINVLPTANHDAVSTLADTAVVVPVLANDTDADGDPLALTTVTQPANGSVVKNSDNSVTYTPNQNYYGVDTFTYTVQDGYQSAEATVTATVLPREPVVNAAAAPAAIMAGDTATLSWSTAWAGSVALDQGIGPVATSGAIAVSPTEDTTYTVGAIGPGGTASAAVAVKVVSPVFRGAMIAAADQQYHESWFGAAVAMSGDYAVVGAPLADVAGKEDCGAAYIFKWEGGTWQQQAKLAAGRGLPWDYFGSAVAISGDQAIIGASYADVDGQYTAGAAYIFQRQGESWVEQGRLTSTDPAAGEYFGSSVGISGNHAIVGVDTRNDNLYTPKVYIFNGNGATWTNEAQFSPSDAESYWHFGNAVAISGNYAVVGAPYNFISGDRGSVYVYAYDGAAWHEETLLTAGDAGADDNFGSAVAIQGDHIIAGAVNHDIAEAFGAAGEGGTLTVDNAGAAYIFTREAGGWFEQAKLTAGDGADWLNFGLAVAINGDYAVVGADHNFHNGANSFSSNYVYRRYGTRWVEQKIFNIGYATESDEFGPHIGLSADHFLVGNYHTGNFPNAGVAYVYDLPRVTANLTAEPLIDPKGESILSWYADNAASCSIAPAIGPVPVHGSVQVKAAETTTYTLTAVGPLGTAVAQATVTVGYPPPTITAAASHTTIRAGEPVTLTWNTTAYTEAVMIDNGLGAMPANGSVEVAPTATMTYTLVASGPGGIASQALSITVLPPEVNLTASPAIITRGEGAVLAWSSTATQTAGIDNGVGSVPVQGSMTVQPTTTTTYTITATGPSGTSTASVTIQVRPPPPTASLAAQPAALLRGQQTTLTWDADDAESVRFGHGMTEFAVGPHGSLTLTPAVTTTYRLEATNQSGTTTEVVTVRVLDPASLAVAITSPQAGENFTVPQVLVQGIVTTGTDEVGVTVNGMPAQVHGNRFFANNVPLGEGENIISVKATEPSGTTVSDTVTVSVDTSQPTEWIELRLNPDSGTAPLVANLRAQWHLSFDPENTFVGFNGPARVSVTPVSPTEADLSFPVPGVYTVTYTAADIHGTEYKQEVMVNVYDRPGLDTLLQARWQGMKGKLALRDIEGGLRYFIGEAKGKYRGAFTALSGELPQLVGDMQGIELIYARDGRAKYRLNRQHEVNGTEVAITYYIYFVKDAAGLWKIEQF